MHLSALCVKPLIGRPAAGCHRRVVWVLELVLISRDLIPSHQFGHIPWTRRYTMRLREPQDPDENDGELGAGHNLTAARRDVMPSRAAVTRSTDLYWQVCLRPVRSHAEPSSILDRLRIINYP